MATRKRRSKKKPRSVTSRTSQLFIFTASVTSRRRQFSSDSMITRCLGLIWAAGRACRIGPISAIRSRYLLEASRAFPRRHRKLFTRRARTTLIPARSATSPFTALRRRGTRPHSRVSSSSRPAQAIEKASIVYREKFFRNFFANLWSHGLPRLLFRTRLPISLMRSNGRRCGSGFDKFCWLTAAPT